MKKKKKIRFEQQNDDIFESNNWNNLTNFVNDNEFIENVVFSIEKTKIIIFVSRDICKIEILILRQIIIEKKNLSSLLSKYFQKRFHIYAIFWKTIKIVTKNFFFDNHENEIFSKKILIFF